MKNKFLTSVILGIFLLSFASALQVDFYYSPTCPHCQQVSPLIDSLSHRYANHEWNFYDITKDGVYNNIQGVPTLIFDKTIRLEGSYEIPKYTECYLKEQSSLECPTYTTWNCTTGWFVRE